MTAKQLLRNKFIRRIPAVLAILLSAIILLLLIPYGNQSPTVVNPIRFEGTYQTAPDSPAFPFTEFNLVDPFSHTSVTLRGHFDRPLPKGEQLLFLIKYLEVRIYLGNDEIYAFGAEESHPYVVRSSGMTWSHCVFPRDLTAEDEVTIVLKNRYQNNYNSAYQDFMGSLQTGDSGALARMVFAESWLYILGSIVFFFLSLLLLSFSFILSACGISVHKSVYLFIGFAMDVSLWIFLDPKYSTLLIGNTALVMQLETLSIMLASILLVAYLGSLMQTEMRRSNERLLHALILLLVLYLILQLLGLTDPYAVRTVLMVALGLVSIFGTWQIYYEIRHNKEHAFRLLLFPGGIFLCSCIIEMINFELEFFPQGKSLFIGFFIWLTAQFVLAVRYLRSAILLSQQAERLEKELMQSRISIMLSQIQPHFLYNALVGIKRLCNVDPQKASDALQHFAFFLRGNLDSLSGTGLITFNKEMEHVRDYLYLEEMRFPERLDIRFELECTDFLLPPMTVQPLVENAVRHGIVLKEEFGTLTIQSERTQNAVVITIADDGVGFDVDAPKNDGRTHVGIDNVRNRLSAQCGGSLEIESVVGVGTTIRMILPQKAASE